MPYPFALGGTLLQAQRSGLSTSFCRYKSITAAIEKGRQSGPGRFSSARPRTQLKDDRPRTAFREDGPRAALGRDDSAPRPRPSRPSRSGSSIGARRRRWENDDGPRAPRQQSDVDRRIRDEDTRFSPRLPGASGSRTTRSERRSAPSDSPTYRGRNDRDHTDRNNRDRSDRDRNDRDRNDDRDRNSNRDRNSDRDRNRDRDNHSSEFPRPLRKTERRLESRLNRTSDRTRDSRDDPREATRDGRDAPARGRSARPDPGPDSLPYTTAASDFIYGYSSVLAAIKANRRQFYRLYVNQRGMSRDVVLASAKAAKLRDITVHVGDEYSRAMDKASSGRPHNVRLLTYPLPLPPRLSSSQLTLAGLHPRSFPSPCPTHHRAPARLQGNLIVQRNPRRAIPRRPQNQRQSNHVPVSLRLVAPSTHLVRRRRARRGQPRRHCAVRLCPGRRRPRDAQPAVSAVVSHCAQSLCRRRRGSSDIQSRLACRFPREKRPCRLAHLRQRRHPRCTSNFYSPFYPLIIFFLHLLLVLVRPSRCRQ
jgi:hypothetical protein